jgi:2-hydroxy-3-keto-5-methylthiopentenyl-1-phosphate phosphatase
MQLVLDWDGTVTEVDTLHMVVERYGDLDVFHGAEEEIGRRLTLQEAIALEMATVREPLESVVSWLLETVRVRTGLADLVARYDPLIVSAGFHELIEPVLAREGVSARLVANHVRADPAGWQASFADAPVCGVCGERCKRSVVAALGPFAYAGDGISDRCVALAADLVFARAGLAEWLDGRGAAYVRFEDLVDVDRAFSAAGGALVPPSRSVGRKT